MKKLLMVVDMQNDFVDGALGTPEAQAIVPKVRAKVAEAVKANIPICFTRDTHDEFYLKTQEGKHLPVEHCIKGTHGHEILDGLIPENAVYTVIDKPTFGYIPIFDILAESDMISDDTEIEIIGICTDICVVSNALIIKALFPEAKVTVDAECCAGVTVESHKAALLTMKMCQVNVINGEV